MSGVHARRYVVAALVLACGLGACGERKEAPAEKPAAQEPSTNASEEPMREVHTYQVVVQAPEDQRLEAREIKLLEGLVGRAFRSKTLAGNQMESLGPTETGQVTFEVVTDLEHRLEEVRTELEGMLSWAKELRFHIEVLPEDQYSNEPTYQKVRKRRSIWSGTAAEFNAFKDKELELWRAAKKGGLSYPRTARAPFLVLREGTEGTKADDFAVVEPWPAGQSFDGRMLDRPRVGTNQWGTTTVLFDVLPAWQKALGEWTEKNVGYPMAVLVDGTYRTAPYINSRLDESVEVMLGKGTETEIRKEAERLKTALQAGQLPRGLRVVDVREVGK